MNRIISLLTLMAVAILVIAWPALAFAQAADISMADAGALLDLAKTHKWLALTSALTIIVVRLVKSDTKKIPTLDPRLRIFLAIAVAALGSAAEKVVEGTTWLEFRTNLETSLFLAVVMYHAVIIDALRGGKEFVVPFLTIPGARPSPTAPATIPTNAQNAQGIPPAKPAVTDDPKATGVEANPPDRSGGDTPPVSGEVPKTSGPSDPAA